MSQLDSAFRIREIPYNYTSFSDREICARFLGEDMWQIVEELRSQRKTGRSARMLFEVLGDMWVITRNPFIQDDLIHNKKRKRLLMFALYHRLDQIEERANENPPVLKLLEKARHAVQSFHVSLEELSHKRKEVLHELSKVTKSENIDFSGLGRVSHATDATDLRVENPFVIIYPDKETEIAPIVRKLIELKLTIIPRGGGTGYSASAVPLFPDTAIINTEKIDYINQILPPDSLQNIFGVHCVHAGAGVVTKHLADAAEKKELIFAVDPTSISASTLGGNIAMNSGGKKAVAWGTAIDNLLSWRMVGPNGQWIEIERVDRDFRKLHLLDEAIFRIKSLEDNGKEKTDESRELRLPGHIFRKSGLGKDVTNKSLGTLPGVQKEGCDGIITSATFMLHPVPKFIRTVCLEFYGAEQNQAVAAILQIKNSFTSKNDPVLTALEHLDERYLHAIKYNVKSASGVIPKMVLFADIGSATEDKAHKAALDMVKIVRSYGGEGFIAITKEARKNFWEDRTRTAAIAAHTNAFKLNEDVVIPIESLAQYTKEIERINIECSIKNKLEMVLAYIEYLHSEMPELKKMRIYVESAEREDIIANKKQLAVSYLTEIEKKWRIIFDNLDAKAIRYKNILQKMGVEKIAKNETILDLLLARRFRVSMRDQVVDRLNQIFSGSELQSVRDRLSKIHKEHRSGRLFVATHMHAGDGNVHTNIPVNSNDYKMMQEAEKIVERIMRIAISLNGVISGEHGIGLTKYRFLDKSNVDDFIQYKTAVDPNGHFNRAKLLPESLKFHVYTPSLRLLRQEALLLEQSQLELLNDSVRNCLRCGKCKHVCSTHVPRANLLYSPRNKILGTGQLIEAFLYEEQTRRGISMNHFTALNDVADHCTVCRRCLKPCPVDIDFGEVTILTRSILARWNKKRSSFAGKMALKYLATNDYRTIQLYYKIVFRPGYQAQKAIARFIKTTDKTLHRTIPKPTNKPLAFNHQLSHTFKKPLISLQKDTLRGLFGLNNEAFIPIFRDPQKMTDDTETVFLFPGCGAERLHVDIALATLALLYHYGYQTVLPPKFVCCGYPHKTNGQIKQAQKIITDNSVLFHRVANTLNYLDIHKVVVDCGTCLTQLESYDLETIFPNHELLDIHELLARNEVTLPENDIYNYIYHDPCHSPLKNCNANQIVKTLIGKEILFSDRCCGESGTLAVSRPDISTQVRYRKEEEIKTNLREIRQLAPELKKADRKKNRIITTCPSCLQGLNRYRDETHARATYIVIELAEQILGKKWRKDFIQSAKTNGIEKVLL